MSTVLYEHNLEGKAKDLPPLNGGGKLRTSEHERRLPRACIGERKGREKLVIIEVKGLGTFPFHALLPTFFVLLLGDPHLLESALGQEKRDKR